MGQWLPYNHMLKLPSHAATSKQPSDPGLAPIMTSKLIPLFRPALTECTLQWHPWLRTWYILQVRTY
jgi:hypothetical protein